MAPQTHAAAPPREVGKVCQASLLWLPRRPRAFQAAAAFVSFSCLYSWPRPIAATSLPLLDFCPACSFRSISLYPFLFPAWLNFSSQMSARMHDTCNLFLDISSQTASLSATATLCANCARSVYLRGGQSRILPARAASQQAARQPVGPQPLRAVVLTALATELSGRIFRLGS